MSIFLLSVTGAPAQGGATKKRRTEKDSEYEKTYKYLLEECKKAMNDEDFHKKQVFALFSGEKDDKNDLWSLQEKSKRKRVTLYEVEDEQDCPTGKYAVRNKKGSIEIHEGDYIEENAVADCPINVGYDDPNFRKAFRIYEFCHILPKEERDLEEFILENVLDSVSGTTHYDDN